MFKKTEKIWLDGKLVPWDEANVHVVTHTLHYGVGAFEGIRYYDCGPRGSAVFRLKDHCRRLVDSCKALAMNFGYSVPEIVDICLETVRVNGLREGYIRPLAFIADGPGVGVWAYDNPVRFTVATWGWGAYLGAEGIQNGIKTKVSSYTRLHRNIAMTKAKVCGQYVNSCLAKQEAKAGGCDEAILLDTEGFVGEGTGENIFLVRDGEVRTPSLGSILGGFTRDTIIKLLREEGISVTETNITRDELYYADEAFFTGTAAEVTPIREVDTRPVGAGKPGPITMKMQKTYADLIRGKLDRYKEWLTFIER